MSIIPTVRCRRMTASIAFYTEVLDFESVEGENEGADLAFRVLTREGHPLFLSSHVGDGAFGQAICILTEDVDALWARFRTRGLTSEPRPESPVHRGSVDQSWGTREFYVDDPDGNTLRFIQGFRLPGSVERA